MPDTSAPGTKSARSPRIESTLSSRSPLAGSIVPYVIVAGVCILLVACLFHPWKMDLRVPLEVDGDAHLHQAIIKNFAEGGHFYINPFLGAPGQQELYDFPSPNWTHVMVWAVLRLFTHSYGVLLNVYYLLTYPLCGLTALYAFRRFGISTGLAIAGAVLFAILPFHLIRSESHLFLSSLYVLPLSGMVIIWLATGNPVFGFELPADVPTRPAITRDGVIALISCVLMGWDHPYYAFFTAGLLLIAGLLGTFRNGHRRAIGSAVLMCAVVAGALTTALVPNIVYFYKHGRVPVANRPAVESEMTPLTLAQLLSPVPDHRVPFLAHLRQYYDTHALMVNENKTASLGFLGSVGFILSLAGLFRRRCSDFLYSLGILNLWGVLLGVMGGFGAIFAFLVSPQIRAYNRISVFIGFFSIAGLVWALDQWLGSHSVRPGIIGMVLAPALLISIGIVDQVPRHFILPRAMVEGQYHEMDAFIGRIESSLPPGSMIFQLPYMYFPERGPIHKMNDYDQLVGYLHSKSLRWSYGAMHFRETDRWQEAVSAEPPDRMIKSLSDAGFSGIFVDRFGYVDSAAALETQLRALLKSEPITDSSGRYLFFRIGQ